MIIKYGIPLLLWSFFTPALFGQSEHPKVGQPMPAFTLQNIQYFKKNKAMLEDFKGKWLLLDFWDKGCGACIAGFPHINTIQQELGDKLQVMLVGNQDKENVIQPLYKWLRKKENLTLPCAFDSAMVNRFTDGAFPNTILIDDKGIVQCWTINMGLSEIKSFMAGKPLDLKTPDDDNNLRIAYDPQLPLLVNDNGGKASDFEFRSVLCKWDRNRNHQSYVFTIDSNVAKTGRLQILGYAFDQLYKLAYWGTLYISPSDTQRYGKVYNKLILDTKDSALFNPYAYRYNSNRFSYSLIMPKEKSSISSMQQAMQDDLKRYFGFKVKVEQKKCPYWKLVALSNAATLLKTKRKIPKGAMFYKSGFNAADIGFELVVDFIKGDLLNGDYVEDATGIKGKVNFLMEYTPSGIDDIQKELNKNGLQLIKDEKEMKVVTITYPTDTP